MKQNSILSLENIRPLIHTVRNQQIMLDSDLAEIYGVELRRLNEQVKRNTERFPEHFRFQLTQKEFENLRLQISTSSDRGPLRSQNATLTGLESQSATSRRKGRGQHRKYLPYVYTEPGVSMLSAVLRSQTAIKVSIQIINAFVEMRHFLQTNAQVFARIDSVEKRQLQFESKTGAHFEKVFQALEAAEPPKQGIFFEGQVHDAHTFVSGLIRKAKKSLILIDNYVDDSVLTLLTKRKKNVTATIYTQVISKQLALDLKKYNEQYAPVTVEKFKSAHDRFLIIDERDIYHIGASLKDLGKKWFAFSKFKSGALEMLQQLESAN